MSDDYETACLAGREAAEQIVMELRGYKSANADLARLVRSLHAAVANSNSVSDEIRGHGIGFLHAIAAAACDLDVYPVTDWSKF